MSQSMLWRGRIRAFDFHFSKSILLVTQVLQQTWRSRCSESVMCLQPRASPVGGDEGHTHLVTSKHGHVDLLRVSGI